MSRPNPGKLAAVLAGLILLAGLPVVIRGGLYITNYEGDALHLADIALRMSAGERPHLDFMTPLGVLAFWPVVLGLKTGAEIGAAFVIGQTLVALLALGPVVWAAWTRLSPRLAYGFGLAAVILLTSLSHGASGKLIAISMHYNRWAWVLSFVAILLAVLKPRGTPHRWIDGAVLALCAAGLVLLKATYVVAFAPALLLILVLRQDWPLLAASAVAGSALVALLAVALGPDFLLAYFGDLLTVARGEVRNQPGLALHDIAISPAYFAGTLTALAGMAILRRSGARQSGLAILILIPAFLYVTWQNFGNDPVWLILLSVLLFALRPARRAATPPEKDPSVGVGLAGFAALVLAFPMLQNHAAGGLRLLTLDTSRYIPVVPDRAGLGDLYMPAFPAELVRGRINLTDPGGAYDMLADTVPDDAPAEFAGQGVPNCQIMTGIRASLAHLAAEVGPETSKTFVADLVSSHWLYGSDGPLPGGAPWTYGSLSGLDAASRLLVPLCAIGIRARDTILSQIEEAGLPVILLRETPTYRLYAIGG